MDIKRTNKVIKKIREERGHFAKIYEKTIKELVEKIKELKENPELKIDNGYFMVISDEISEYKSFLSFIEASVDELEELFESVKSYN